MLKRTLTLLAVVVLWPMLTAGSCATTAPEPRIEIRTVEIPVAIACVPRTVEGRQTYADTREALLAAGGADQRYHLMAGEWPRRDARLQLLEGVLAACR